MPGARFEFINVRLDARKWAKVDRFVSNSYAELEKFAQKAIGVLGQYGGDGSRTVVRSFAFVTDIGLRAIIERDYRELKLNVYPGGAWKSTVVLAGSILEALLYDQLSRNVQQSEASPEAPRANKNGPVKPFGDKWTLEDLIKVAADTGVIQKVRADSIDQILRDYRNFVHPRKEVRSQHPCTEAEAMMAMGCLEGVCNILK